MDSLVTSPVRILLLDGQPLSRAGWRLIVESDPDCIVVGEASNYEEATQAALAQPDVILVNVLSEAELDMHSLPELLKQANGARLIALTGCCEVELQHRIIRLGATGLVRKTEQPATLLKAIKKVHAGEVWLNPSMLARILSEFQRPQEKKRVDPEAEKLGKLTSRERETIALIGEGLRNKEIAERLYVSESTVRNHLGSIFSKLGLSDRLKLIIYAMRNGLITIPGVSQASAESLH